ncbi:MAG: response regulator transcription factor [Acidimicrobiia bacterium]|nr:response regulator transcription factor [Acidimicrobiia bacterium]NNF63052.1 response regulator transcription factor [Acidimicrobiia bacterium]
MPADPPRILVIEDEPSLADSIRYNLELEGYDVVVAKTGRKGMERFRKIAPSLVLLDVMLPEMSGLDVCRLIRSQSDVPIIMLTARSSEGDVVAGLELGADDYVTKPFSMRELVSRVRANLRRALEQEGEDRGEELVIGPIRLNPGRHEVVVDGEVVEFRPKEFQLLEFLMSRKGRLVTRERLIDEIWGSDYYGDTKTLNVHIKRIRAKIGDKKKPRRWLVTVRGLGYKFVDE